MKLPWSILILGVLAAVTAFWAGGRLANRANSDAAASHGHRHDASPPESHSAALEWLRTEFHLDSTTFERIRQLHLAYQPRCAELCRRIDEHNQRLALGLTVSSQLTDEARQLISEGARVRAECQTALASHLLEVAGCMPPEQGRRYLSIMLPATGITGSSHPISQFDHARPHP